MDVNSRNRTELKSYFLKNSIPTESNFGELIDGMLNQKDDGVVKLPGNPLSIEAAGDNNSPQKAINFYRNFTATQPDWTISLNPWANANDPATARAGFSITDGEGNNRLFIDRSTGHLGVKTTSPGAALDVKADTITAGGWFEALRLSQGAHSAITHPGGGLLFGLHGNRNFYFGDIKDGAIQKYLMIINADSGNVAIGSDPTTAKLNVNGDTNINGTLRFAANASQAIYGAARVNKNTVVIKGHWDELEVKGRVIEWTGSNLHIGMENDHTGHAVYIGNGKLDKVEIQGNTNLVVGGSTTTNALSVTGDTTLKGLAIGDRAQHWDADGAIYRYSGQVYITVDDNLYVRDAGGDIKFHFNTNNGALDVKGIINAPNTAPIRQQLVHRRVVFGFAGDAALDYSLGWKTIRYTYGPFNYAVPALQAGATRKFRLYAIYSDNMTSHGENQVRFRMDNGIQVIFSLGLTWGHPMYNRDAYSSWFEGAAPDGHGYLEIQTTASGSVGRIYYLELQTWDFF